MPYLTVHKTKYSLATPADIARIVAGLIGAGILGAGLGVAWEKIVKRFFKDDESDMLDICNQVFDECICERCMTEQEAEEAAKEIKITSQLLRQMYAEEDREGFVRTVVDNVIDKSIPTQPL